MATKIIYHNFQQDTAFDTDYPSQKHLAKQNRIYKTAAKVNKTLNTICAYLCGTCMVLSMLAFLVIALYT